MKPLPYLIPLLLACCAASAQDYQEKGTSLKDQHDLKGAIYWYAKGAREDCDICLDSIASILKQKDLSLGDKDIYTYLYNILNELEAKKPRGVTENCLGWMYFYGYAVPEDKTKYFQWELASAKNHYLLGILDVGLSYLDGSGVQIDTAQGKLWLNEAAGLGQPDAITKLGYLSEYGSEKNLEIAERYFQRAADLNFAPAYNALGWLYEFTPGHVQDHAKSIAYFRKAVTMHDAAAECHIGIMYLEGRGVQQDDTQAAYWFKNAFADKNPYGEGNYAILMYEGRGNVPQDKALARKLLKEVIDELGSESTYFSNYLSNHP